MTAVTVYYDASCPLCVREMATIMALDVGQEISMQDCSTPDFFDTQADAAGITPAEMMRLIHARLENGKWLVGVDVFIELYQRVGLSGVARVWAHPFLGALLRRIYPWIARHRQRLSRLGINRIYEYAIERAAKRALAQSQRCKADQCELPPGW